MSLFPPDPPPLDAHIRTLIRLAVDEDMGIPPHDRTVELAIPPDLQATATIVARQPGILSGTYLIAPILACYATPIPAQINIRTNDGQPAVSGQQVATIVGNARQLLSAERVLLNFLQKMSGIASKTHQYVEKIAPFSQKNAKNQQKPVLCDTRKTTPAFRLLDKYATACGGAINHRLALHDGVMLKDNHLVALKSRLGEHLMLAQLTAHIRSELEMSIPLWLEVDSLAQLEEALPGGGADIILIDNFSHVDMSKAVVRRDALSPHTLLEASGGITLANIADVAATGVDRISVGAITHSAGAMDLSMEFS